MNDQTEKARESRLRRLAKSQGFVLRKSRFRKPEARAYSSGFMIVNTQTNTIEAGQNFDLTLDEVENFLSEQ
jgi:hypothetical protein